MRGGDVRSEGREPKLRRKTCESLPEGNPSEIMVKSIVRATGSLCGLGFQMTAAR
jgi:hypothetical protein